MKFYRIIFFIAIFSVTGMYAQQTGSFMKYYELTDFMHAAPGAFKYGMYGYDNPAMMSYFRGSDLMLTASDKDASLANMKRWGMFYGANDMSLGAIHLTDSGREVTDYRLSAAMGDKNFAMGIAYGWTTGDRAFFKRSSSLFNLGFLYRPNSYLSFGLHGTTSLDNDDHEYIADLSVRPIKNYPLTLFADMAAFNDKFKSLNWSAGISFEPIDGVRLNGRYFDTKKISIGVDLSLGFIGVSTHTNLSSAGVFDYNSYSVRVGNYDRTFLKSLIGLTEERENVKIWLNKPMKYQKSIFFDNSETLMDMLEMLEDLKKEEAVKAITINICGMSINREMLWELREKLLELKAAGKKIYMFADNASLDEYHFISIADKIILDPLGSISFEGYRAGKSYYKNLFDKVGVGIDELRFFKFKSAVETLARDKMSDGDREQLQKLIDDWYSITRNDICKAKSMTEAQFDSLVNQKIFYMAKECIEKKLVDTTGRWENIDEIIKKIEKNKGYTAITGAMVSMMKDEKSDLFWSEPEKIAVIYAVGECAMETGIKARELVNHVKAAATDKSIKAIVLRVDSPGGDAMASDYIAAVIKEYKDKKPIIVSQGWVAASGGYWLSMNATKILAAPLTITGSIGVISLFPYDKGLKEKLGITTTVLKTGKYSDLAWPFTLPFIGMGLPDRPLTTDERGQMESSIKSMYQDFVDRVATGRNMKSDSIGQLAQGRVWSGLEAKKIGLIDEFGGLDKAISLAKELAHIDKEENVKIIEMPIQTSINMSELLSKFTGSSVKAEDRVLSTFKFVTENSMKPLVMMPMDFWELVPEKQY
ncbi:MAG: signal peptide peptidase SppA [Candidatus Kapabacteria bacterium]|nr:signal peptide peptidase SppA [Candidatus Kapabacteria bacterium]